MLAVSDRGGVGFRPRAFLRSGDRGRRTR